MSESSLTKSQYGYWLSFEVVPEETSHQFCGEHNIPGAECPTCDKPLLRLLSLNTIDPRLNIGSEHPFFIHLFYCWTCSIPFGSFQYQCLSDGIKLLTWKMNYDYAFGPEGPYDGYTGTFFGQIVGLTELSEGEHSALRVLNDGGDLPEAFHYLHEPRHQIGGSPLIYNAEEVVTCHLCGNDMPLLAVICDNAAGQGASTDGRANTFTDNSGVRMVFHYCGSCAVVGAYHCCD